ncbi:MAG: MFS transporter [Alphaproteobacteria bacterium]|nr:MFS transporter [Alphaproteobacteria bacterium]
MTDLSRAAAPPIAMSRRSPAALSRALVIGLTAFLTLVDLFATQAILPSLVEAYGVSPAAMGLAVNASTVGMAVSGLAVAAFGRHIDRRRGIAVSLALLALPTFLLAAAPDLGTFAALRVVQGLLMSAAFTLTLAYLGEHFSAEDAAGVFAAYVTGNVASNLIGRMMAAALADHLGLAASFHVFALLNLAGAVLVRIGLDRATPMEATDGGRRSVLEVWGDHLRNSALRGAFAVGFLILFAFIGTFTYVNFVLVAPPFGVGMMTLGVVYLVFAPSVVTTPLAGRAVRLVGPQRTLMLSLLGAVAGLPLLLAGRLEAVLAGLVLVAVGTFLAQATATGFVGRTAMRERGAASGLYLAFYFLGGLAGSAAVGQVFVRLGWAACVATIGLSLLAAAAIAARLGRIAR